MPDHPLVLFDGRCGFCRIWIEYWKAHHRRAGRVRRVARRRWRVSADSGQELQPIRAVSYAGRGSIERRPGRIHDADLRARDGLAAAWLYEHVPGFAPATEAAYRLIAGASDVLLPPDAADLRKTRPAAEVREGGMAFSAAPGGDLSDRFCVAGRTNHGIDRRPRHSCRWAAIWRQFRRRSGCAAIGRCRPFFGWRTATGFSKRACWRAGARDRAAAREY